MSEYTEDDVRNACHTLGLAYNVWYGTGNRKYAKRVGTEIGHFNKEFFVNAKTALLIADAIHRAAEDAKEIESYLELLYQKSTKTDESSEWKPWPGTTPPEDEECIVTFTENGKARTLIGRYHAEFDLWAFPTLDGRVQTFTRNDKAYSLVIYKPLEA